MTRIAIIGSRRYPNLEQVREYVRSLPLDVEVVSGGVLGVDQAAAAAAEERGIAVREYLPDYDYYGPKAPLIRNQLIVDRCTRLVAFCFQNSAGTMHTVGLARKAGKPVEVITPLTRARLRSSGRSIRTRERAPISCGAGVGTTCVSWQRRTRGRLQPR